VQARYEPRPLLESRSWPDNRLPGVAQLTVNMNMPESKWPGRLYIAV
jgi:hypothetical protein